MPYNKKGKIKYRNVGGGLLDRKQNRYADVRAYQHKGLLNVPEPVVETPISPATPVNTENDTTTNPGTTTPVVKDPMDVTKDDPAIQKIAKMIDSQSDYISDTATNNPAYVAPGEQATISPGTGTVDSGPGPGFGYNNNTNPITGLPNNDPAPLPDDNTVTDIQRQLEEEAAQKAAEEARAAAEAAAIEEARIKEAEAAAAELARRKEVERQLAEKAAAERLAAENAAKAKAEAAGLSYTDGNYGFQDYSGSFDEAKEFKLDFDNTQKANETGVTYDQKSNTFLDKNGKAFGNSIDAQKSNTAIAAAEAKAKAEAKEKALDTANKTKATNAGLGYNASNNTYTYNGKNYGTYEQTVSAKNIAEAQAKAAAEAAAKAAQAAQEEDNSDDWYSNPADNPAYVPPDQQSKTSPGAGGGGFNSSSSNDSGESSGGGGGGWCYIGGAILYHQENPDIEGYLNACKWRDNTRSVNWFRGYEVFGPWIARKIHKYPFIRPFWNGVCKRFYSHLQGRKTIVSRIEYALIVKFLINTIGLCNKQAGDVIDGKYQHLKTEKELTGVEIKEFLNDKY